MIAEVSMLTLTRSADVRKQERSRTRFFASELIDALRGRHKNSRVLPVVIGEIDEPARVGKEAKGKWKVLGGYHPSKWERANYAALVFSPEYLEPDGTAYQVQLNEDEFEAVRGRLVLQGLACGAEQFPMDARKRIHPVREYACELCELLATIHQVYRKQDGEFQRNAEYVNREKAEIADTFLEAAKIIKISISAN